MARKITTNLTQYINARDAAAILSKKHNRSIRTDYVCKVPNIRSILINASTRLYLRSDIEAAIVSRRTGRRLQKRMDT